MLHEMPSGLILDVGKIRTYTSQRESGQRRRDQRRRVLNETRNKDITYSNVENIEQRETN